MRLNTDDCRRESVMRVGLDLWNCKECLIRAIDEGALLLRSASSDPDDSVVVVLNYRRVVDEPASPYVGAIGTDEQQLGRCYERLNALDGFEEALPDGEATLNVIQRCNAKANRLAIRADDTDA